VKSRQRHFFLAKYIRLNGLFGSHLNVLPLNTRGMQMKYGGIYFQFLGQKSNSWRIVFKNQNKIHKTWGDIFIRVGHQLLNATLSLPG